MLDWSTSIIECDASKLEVGRVIRLDSAGKIDYEIPTWESFEAPSYDARIRLRPFSPTSSMIDFASQSDRLCPSVCLKFSGNPTRFLQGHNVVGPSTIFHSDLLVQVLNSLNIFSPIDFKPALSRSRLDVNLMFDFGYDCSSVHSWLTLISSQSRTRHREAISQSSTVYWNRGSRRWTIKAYCKYCELLKHPHKDEKIQKVLLDYCSGKLRIELTLRGQELKQYETIEEDIIYKYYERITMSKLMNDNVNFYELVKLLPNFCKATLYQWQSGACDYQSMSIPKNTFYRHRREILAKLGIDISLPYNDVLDTVEAGNTANMDRYAVSYLKQRQEPLFPSHEVSQHILKF